MFFWLIFLLNQLRSGSLRLGPISVHLTGNMKSKTPNTSKNNIYLEFLFNVITRDFTSVHQKRSTILLDKFYDFKLD